MKNKLLIAAVALAGSAALVLGPATTAMADAYIYTPYKSCTGSSFVYTTGVASGNHSHTHLGPTVRDRTFEGLPFVYKTTRYYGGAQGNYRGLVVANVFGDISSASIACDY